MRRAQAWSTDLIIGVLIFLLVIGVFYMLLTSRIDSDTTQLRVESETVATRLVSDENVGFITDDVVDSQRLETFSQQSLEDMKASLGVRSDFCVFFEDEDGNLIPIRVESGNYTGLGASSINVSGEECYSGE